MIKTMTATTEMIEHLPAMQRAFANWMVLNGKIKIVDKPSTPTKAPLDSDTPREPMRT
ncbi:MAG: hypothetical protein U9N40_05045 [Euryarchaeota archaeon]|nr:hypothetical protein [Euryarchaeota archaeon]